MQALLSLLLFFIFGSNSWQYLEQLLVLAVSGFKMSRLSQSNPTLHYPARRPGYQLIDAYPGIAEQTMTELAVIENTVCRFSAAEFDLFVHKLSELFSHPSHAKRLGAGDVDDKGWR